MGRKANPAIYVGNVVTFFYEDKSSKINCLNQKEAKFVASCNPKFNSTYGTVYLVDPNTGNYTTAGAVISRFRSGVYTAPTFKKEYSF